MTTPQRRVDAAALKGLAHPMRVDLLDALVVGGPATASALAEQLGESSGATSYHLRQLARHGYIEDDPDHASGRERWWRVVHGGMTIAASGMGDDAAAREAVGMVARQFIDQRARRADAFIRAGERGMGADWVDASVLSSATASLTLEEMGELSELLMDTLSDFLDPRRERDTPHGARRVATHINVFPLEGEPESGS
ncbi:ArsR/SmtB family transcription factor [Demequina flava]|uniref:ArsR/SmtB family transcription factor n=1 Tax=Demequina flava TaxID=1095025 RepID=UPI000783E92D|nr:helix-turn-helix domain-containing protein [Demequina flava]